MSLVAMTRPQAYDEEYSLIHPTIPTIFGDICDLPLPGALSTRSVEVRRELVRWIHIFL